MGTAFKINVHTHTHTHTHIYIYIYSEVFGVTRHKLVSTVTDTKLVAETVVTKELGKGRFYGNQVVKARFHGNAHIKRKERVEVCASFAVLLWPT
jgi:hypothetical protein